MNITELEFTRFVSSAGGPEHYGVFDLVRDDLAVAEAMAVSLIGAEFFKSIFAEPEFDDDSGAIESLQECIKRYVCLAAFERAIPSLDLVLTPTGFGVVSNQNTAPASAERVERLRHRVELSRDYAFDCLLDELRGFPEWSDTDVAKRYFRSLVWRCAFLKFFGVTEATRSKLEELATPIAAAERQLIFLISPEFHEEMLDAVRHDRRSGHLSSAIDLARSFIYACHSGVKTDIFVARGNLLGFLDKWIERFPTYRDSSAYSANHSKPYENRKDDPCHFFG